MADNTHRNMKILVVEDVPEEREGFLELLKMEGYEVSAVATASEAIEALKNSPYDLVVLDIVLPDMDGIELLKKLKSLQPDTDMIVITAYATLERAVASIKEGVYDFLIKPFSNNEFILSIERVKEKRRLQAEREHFEKKLMQASDEWRRTFDSLKDGIMLLDRNFNIIKANRSISILSGFDIKEIVGKKCFEVIHNTDEPPEWCPVSNMLGEKTHIEAEFYEPLLKRHLYVELIPVFDEQDRLTQYIHTFKDITEKKTLQRKLRNTVETIYRVYECSPYPIGILTPDYRFKYINPEMEKLIGKKKVEIEGRYCYEVIHGKREACEDCVLQEVLRSRRSVWDQRHCVTEAGRESFFERVFYPLFDEEGNIESIVEIIKDITELKLTEKKLRESEAFLTSVLEGIGDAVLVIDRQMRILSANKGYLTQTKRRLEEVVGKYCYEMSHGYSVPCDKHGEDCAVRKTFKDGKYHIALHIHTAKNGTKHYAETHAYPLRDSEGRIYAVVETITDVTTKVTLQKKLEESEKRYRTLYNSAPDMMLSLDIDGDIIECNETTLKSLGYEKQEILGRSFIEIVAKEFWKVYEQNCRKIKEKGYYETELEVLRKDGKRLKVLAKAVAIKDKDGTHLKTSVTLRDVTELRKLESEKQHLQEQLLQAQKMEAIGTLAAGIAHDFNNMLMGISGFTQIAYMKTDSEQIKEYMQKILNVIDKAKTLTNQILILGKKVPTKKQPLDINRFIETSLSTIRRMVEENIDIETQLSSPLPLIMADEGQLYQVILNLIVNARDVLKEGGKITIKTGKSLKPCMEKEDYMCVLRQEEGSYKEYVWISVQDNGPGIPNEIKHRIFEPFFTTKELAKGTGLGLSIVYSVVQEHGGSIDLKTAPDKGTEFVLFFPVSEQTAPEETKPEIKDISLKGKGKAVLVADDEEVIRDFLSEFMRELGFDVITVKDGKEALSIYQKFSDNFTLVIIDRVMPGLSGREVIEYMRKLNPSQKALISTGYADTEELEEFRNLKDIKILKKPFRTEELLAAIKELLNL
jgi:PAS domain S-box-containing protein